MPAAVGPHGTPDTVHRQTPPIHTQLLLAASRFGTVITFIPTFVHGEGLGRVTFFFTAYTASAILTRVIGAGLSDSLGRRRVVLPTLLALALSILVLALVHGVGLLVVAGAPFGAARGISYPTLHALLGHLPRHADAGR